MVRRRGFLARADSGGADGVFRDVQAGFAVDLQGDGAIEGDADLAAFMHGDHFFVLHMLALED